MNITIDIGNTNINIALYNKHQMINQSKMETVDCQTSSDVIQLLKTFDLTEVLNVGLSCVVPRLYSTVKSELQSLGYNLFIITPDNLPDVDINAVDRNEMGADLLAAAIGAIKHYPTPCLVADLGSASKLIVINKHQGIEGVIIQPGIKMSFEAMVSNIKQLPKIDFELPASVIGHDTISALQSGLLFGAVASINGMADLISQETGEAYTKILTGGYSNIIYQAMPDFIFDPNLLLDGINEILLERFG
jgi:type III pantothenate kinase